MVAISRLLVLALLLVVAWPATSGAHEIPKRVTVQAFVKPEGRVLHVLVRVPLEAMRDVEWRLRGPGYLDLARSDTLLRDAAKLWVADGLAVYENDTRLGNPRIVTARAALPSDRAFAAYPSAAASMQGARLPDATNIPWQQVMLDVALEYDIQSDSAAFAIDPAYAKLGVQTNTVVRFLPPRGVERAYAYTGDPGLLVLDPGAFTAAWRFVRLGFEHILDGADHLLFLLCLIIPFRSVRPLVALVTAFTVAHSLTLFASALGVAPDGLWFPPLIEFVIALSIVYMACENMLGATLDRRWVMTFGFGLVHGFGFSFALRNSLQFAGAHLVTSLAAFNVGVELGQLAVLAAAIPLLVLLFKRIPERAGVVLLSAFVAHTGWHWSLERWETLAQYRVTVPVLNALFVADIMRGLMIVLVVGGAGWLLHAMFGRYLAKPLRAPLLLLACGGALTLLPLGRAQAQGGAASGTTVRTTRTTMGGVYTAEQARQGREVFVGTCTGCHTPAAHTGVVFTSKWVGRSVGDLFTFISNSMPKIAPGSLSEDEYLWVTAYILKLNGMPAGPRELSAEPDSLGAVRIDTVRPRAKVVKR